MKWRKYTELYYQYLIAEAPQEQCSWVCRPGSEPSSAVPAFVAVPAASEFHTDTVRPADTSPPWSLVVHVFHLRTTGHVWQSVQDQGSSSKQQVDF